MSMTKRYLESLAESEQNAILGEHDYFQRLPEPVDTFTQVAVTRKCAKCGDTLPASMTGDRCEWCARRAYRRERADRYYGSRR